MQNCLSRSLKGNILLHYFHDTETLFWLCSEMMVLTLQTYYIAVDKRQSSEWVDSTPTSGWDSSAAGNDSPRAGRSRFSRWCAQGRHGRARVAGRYKGQTMAVSPLEHVSSPSSVTVSKNKHWELEDGIYLGERITQEVFGSFMPTPMKFGRGAV